MSELILKTTRDTILNFASIVVSLVSGFIISVLVAREIGPSAQGAYSFLMFGVSLTITVFTFGLPQALSKYVPEFIGQGKPGLAKFLLFRGTQFGALLAILGGGALFLFLTFFADRHGSFVSTKHFLWAGLIVFPSILTLIWKNFLTGKQNFRALLLINLATSMVVVVLTIIVLGYNLGLSGLVAVNLLAALLSLIFTYIATRASTDREPAESANPAQLHEIYQYVWPLALISLLEYVVWQYSEVLFLGIFRPSAEVSFYSIPFNISLMVMNALPGAFISTMIPIFSKYFGNQDTEGAALAFRSSMKMLLILTFPIVAGVIALSGPIITVLYGAEYQPVAKILPILITSTGLAHIAIACTALLYSQKKQRTVLQLMVVSAIVNIALDLFLIPRFGFVGASIANILAQTLAFALAARAVSRIVPRSFPKFEILRIAGATILMGALVVLIQSVTNPMSGMFLGMLVGLVTYPIFLIRFGGLNAQDRSILHIIHTRLPKFLQSMVLFISQKLTPAA